MNKSLEPTLTGLIPDLTGPIPKELINVATSLLAQSRQRVSNLRPEEEAARGYLCAHLACERMRKPLDLPKIQPRPPLPKKAYTLLYTQFQNALPLGTGPSSGGTTGGVGGRSLRSAEKERDKKGREREQRPLAKGKMGAKRVIPVIGGKRGTGSGGGRGGGGEGTVPDGITPAILSSIHTLCTTIEVSAINAIPHLISGMRVLLSLHPAPPPKQTKGEIAPPPYPTPEQLPAMLTALYIITAGALQNKPLSGKEVTRMRKLGLEILRPPSSPRDTKALDKEVLFYYDSILESPTGLEWARGVPEIAKAEALEPSSSKELTMKDNEEAINTAAEEYALQDKALEDLALKQARKRRNEDAETGIGTMLQDRVNYTSAKKIANYTEWKTRIMLRVAEIESQNGTAGRRDTRTVPMPVEA